MGTAVAWASSRLLAAFVFGVTPTDATTYAVAIATLTLCVVAACAIPIRRATRCDPTALLRT